MPDAATPAPVPPETARQGSEDPRVVLLPVRLDTTLQHGPEELDPHALVGREALLRRLVALLQKTKRARACYLVGGYRGAGKTLTANRAIDLYAKSRGGKLPAQPSAGQVLDYLTLAGTSINTKRSRLRSRVGTLLREIRDRAAMGFRAVRSLTHPPIVKLQINLSKRSLTARDVMFEITSMLLLASSRISRRRIIAQGILLVPPIALMLVAPQFGFLSFFQAHAISLMAGIPALPLGSLASVVALALISILVIGSPGRVSLLSTLLLAPSLLAITSLLATISVEPTMANLASSTLIAAASAPSLVLYMVTRPLRGMWRVLHNLHERIITTRHEEVKTGSSWLQLTKRSSLEPINEHMIEMDLIEILRRNSEQPLRMGAIDPIIIIDELDKLGVAKEPPSPSEDEPGARLDAIEDVLSNLKNLLTVAKARFFVIAGRDMLDRYQAERRATSSLYETLFDQYFEVPSLLTDRLLSDQYGFATMTETYVCRRLMRHADAIAHWITVTHRQEGGDTSTIDKIAVRRYLERASNQGDAQLLYLPYKLCVLNQHYSAIHKKAEDGCAGNSAAAANRVEEATILLRHFIHYLTFYSAGNCKKLQSLFDAAVRPTVDRGDRVADSLLDPTPPTPSTVLRFSHRHQRRIILGSTLYIVFYHHLSRQLQVGSDKLAVSTLNAFHNVLKFHSVPFSRHQIELILKADDTHRAAEIDHTVDTLLSQSLRGLILKTFGGLHQYRFNYVFEQELAYICRTSDLEAATYNFSVSSMEAVRLPLQRALKEAYRLFGETGVPEADKGAVSIAELNMTLAETFVLERDFERAERLLAGACDALERAYTARVSRATFRRQSFDLVAHLIECYLKLGLVFERRSRFDRAAVAYLAAREHVVRFLANWREHDVFTYLAEQPRRRKLLAQPFLALSFLRLKRSPDQCASQPGDWSKREGQSPELARLPFVQKQLADLDYYANDTARAAKSYRDILMACHDEIMLHPMVSGSKNMHAASEELVSLTAETCVRLAEVHLREFSETVHKAVKKLDGWREQSEVIVDAVVQFLEIPSDLTDDCIATLKADDTRRLRQLLRPRSDDTPKFYHLIALCKLGGLLFARKGRHYRAGCAYMKGCAIWSMCFDLIVVDQLDHLDEDRRRELGARWSSWRKCLALLFHEAEQNFADADDRAGTRYKTTLAMRDLSKDREKGEDDVSVSSRRTLLELSSKSDTEKRRLLHWYDSLAGQQLTWMLVWADFLGYSFADHNGSSNHYLLHLNQRDTPLYSTRALIMSHWVNGRIQQRQLVREHDTLDDDAWALAGKAIQNFYSAARHIRILAGNDQSWMFPPQAFVFYRLWSTLYYLVKKEKRRIQRSHATPPINVQQQSYTQAVVGVRQELADRWVKPGTQAMYLDLRYVTDRALRYLRSAENVRDAGGRVRAETLRNRFYLAGDFADPQFQLDFTLLETMGPTAAALQTYITETTRKLRPTGERQPGEVVESLWAYELDDSTPPRDPPSSPREHDAA